MNAAVHNLSTYLNLKCRCPVCRKANNVKHALGRDRRQAALTANSSVAPHGTVSTYVNYRCRCYECRESWRLYRAGLRLRHADAARGQSA